MEDIGELLKRLELELLEPDVRADASRLDALLADDFAEVGASGRMTMHPVFCPDRVAA